ncbi:MFS transporter [Actinokineospora fastidiosa]|uniref:MFS transporter n=1 Tax=Actinokineospora fastidiosa TaxID=1816 RepID=A0A918GNJ1_9PSEU|nr:MFS transporter [Actinokineospora fastidiosa]GGS45240.1 MFS transporter [Actinokineospora fastidiosa]
MIQGPLAHRAFRTFLLARVISVAGSAMAPIALAFAVIDRHAEPSALALVLAATITPQAILSLIGGVSADRFPRRTILATGNCVAGAAQATVAVLLFTDKAPLPWLTALAATSGAASAFTLPAMQGIVPQLVPPEDLQQANALIRLPVNAFKVGGPVLVGILITVASPEWALAWDAATFFISAALFSRLRVARVPKKQARFRQDLAEGWKEVRQRPWLWGFVLHGSVVVMAWMAGFQFLGPIAAASSYGGGPAWGVVQGAFAAGLVVGSLGALRWQPSRPLLVCIAASFPMALPALAMAGQAPIWLVVAAALVTGVGMDLSIIAWSTFVQRRLPAELLGRVSSYMTFGELIVVPFGYLIAGQLATVIGHQIVLYGASAMIVVATLVLMAFPAVRRADRPVAVQTCVST